MMMRVTPRLASSAAATSLLLLAATGTAFAEDAAPTITYKFGGYAKFDAMFSDYSDATPAGNSLMRQFYYAPQIPIGDGTG